MRFVLLVAIVVGLVACRNTNYGNYGYAVSPAIVKMSPQVKEIGKNGKVDMLWVIGGMTEQSENFRSGVTTFMKTFVKNEAIDWRMGVISTDPRYDPFLGMGAKGVFDKNTPNPGPILVDAVMHVLNSYDGEQLFDPTVKALSDNTNFMRQDAILAIILTNDNHDTSRKVVQAQDMLDFLKQVKGGLNKVLVYGIIGSTDLGCNLNDIDEDWSYKGSPIETVIKATGGEGLSLCSANFGALLAQIGDHLTSQILQSRVLLTKRPVTSSIVVSYRGQILPGGPKDKGGYWIYNVRQNSIVFYDLAFATQENDSVEITYTEDIGITP